MPSTIHCDHLIEAQISGEKDLSRAKVLLYFVLRFSCIILFLLANLMTLIIFFLHYYILCINLKLFAGYQQRSIQFS